MINDKKENEKNSNIILMKILKNFLNFKCDLNVWQH